MLDSSALENLKSICRKHLVPWFEGNIITDWKKAPNLAQMLFRVSKTNLEGVANVPTSGGGSRQAFHFQHVLYLKLTLLAFIDLYSFILPT